MHPHNTVVSAAAADDDMMMMTTTMMMHNNNIDAIMACDDVELEVLSTTSNQEATMVFEQWLYDCDSNSGCNGNGNGTAAVSYSSSSTTAISFNPSDTSSSSSSSTTSTSLHNSDDDEIALMEIDEQIGSNFLRDDVFGGGCNGGTGTCDDDVAAFDNFNFPSAGSADDDDVFFPPLVEFQFGGSDIEDAFLQVTPPSTSTLTTPPPGPPSPLIEDARYQEVLKKLEASMKRSRETRKSLTMKTDKTFKYNRTESVSGVLSSIERSSRQLQTILKSVHCARSA